LHRPGNAQRLEEQGVREALREEAHVDEVELFLTDRVEQLTKSMADSAGISNATSVPGKPT